MPEQLPGQRPTLEAVAERAGVSRATASRVVNGGDGVRAHLVEKVREAVRELGYVPNPAARALVTRRTGAVAVIIAEPEIRIFSDPFFSRQLRGISKELTAQDTQLVLLLVEDRGDYDRIERYLAGGHVDGALAFSLHTDDPLPAITRRVGMPTVYGGRPGWTAGSGGTAVSRTWTRTTAGAPARPYGTCWTGAGGGSRTSPVRWTRLRRWTGSTAIGTYCSTPIPR